MGVKYIGGIREHIHTRRKHKNANRWLHAPKQKEKQHFGADYWLSVISLTVGIAVLFEFVWLIAK